MSQVSAENKEQSLDRALEGLKILLVAPSLDIMGGQAVQADLLYRNFKSEGVGIAFLPHNPVPWGPLKYLTRIKYLRTLIVSIFYVASLLMRIRKYDVIHVFSASYLSFLLAPTPALLIARLYNKKSILNYRSGEAEDHLTRGGRLVSSILKLADKIVVPSGYLVGVFAQFGFKAEYVFNISDFSQFKYRERNRIKPKIIVARNLEPLYDIETSIKAFAIVKERYPEAVMTIVGDGSARRRLHSLVDKMKQEGITFTGRVERSEIGQLFDQADIFLNSSLIDNMPVAIIEAFYAGLPIVTTDAGGIPYIIRDRENGLLAKMRDHNGLANAIVELIENRELAGNIIAGGHSNAKRFCWEAVKFNWAGIYRELVPEDG